MAPDPDRPEARSWLERLLPSVRRRRLLRELGATFVPNGRDEYLYCDGDRRLPIYAERLGGPYDVQVSADGIGHWLPPHDAAPLSAEQRREVLRLFLRWLAIFDRRVLRVDVEPGDRSGG
jgi:hypothetical protein